MISEQAINAAVAWLDESDDHYEQTLQKLQAENPVLLSYHFSETFSACSRRQRQSALDLALVLYQAVKSEREQVPPVTEEQLSQAEERNWDLLQDGAKSRHFHERLDVFFEDSPQEELLAFLEDALSDDSDGWVTLEGREALYASLKSIVDCIT